MYTHTHTLTRTGQYSKANKICSSAYEVGKGSFTVVSTEIQFILVLVFIHYCIIFHTNNCKPTFAPPCI